MNKWGLPNLHPTPWMSSVLKIGHIATAMLPLFMTKYISWDWTLAFSFVFKQPLTVCYSHGYGNLR